MTNASTAAAVDSVDVIPWYMHPITDLCRIVVQPPLISLSPSPPQVFIHPIAPVLNETRALVKQFNLIYKKKVEMVKGETFFITLDLFVSALYCKLIFLTLCCLSLCRHRLARFFFWSSHWRPRGSESFIYYGRYSPPSIICRVNCIYLADALQFFFIGYFLSLISRGYALLKSTRLRRSSAEVPHFYNFPCNYLHSIKTYVSYPLQINYDY